MRIDTISEKQRARFAEWAAKWIEVGLSTKPADFDRATSAALRAYKLCNLERPMVILRMSSPYGATIGGAMAWMMLREIFGKHVQQQVRQQVWEQVEQQVQQQVWEQVGEQARDGFYNYGVNGLWASWGAYVSFFRDVMGWKDTILERFEIDEALIESCGWTWWHQNVLAISDRPEVIHRDGRGRLHSDSEMAIRYRDGWGFYAVHGVVVPDWIIEQPERLDAARIEEEGNAEVRRIMIDRFGPARYVKESGAKVVHQMPGLRIGQQWQPGGTLLGLVDARLLVKNVPDDEPIVYVDLLNSTPEPDGTIKRYMLRVDPNAYDGEASRNCLAAVASTWRNKDGSLAFKRPQDYRPAFES